MTEQIPGKLDDLAVDHASGTFAALSPNLTVNEALASIRAQNLDSAIVYFYVVDDDRRLCGVVPTRRLLTAAPGTRISALMTDASVTLPLSATLRDAAETLVEHRLLAVPIVGERGRIQGVLDVSALGADVFNEVTGRRRKELFELLGVRVTASPGKRFLSRMSALTWNIAGGLIAAGVAGAFGHLLETFAALALFMPVTLALSESIGMQAVAIALESPSGAARRSLATLRAELGVAFPLAFVSAVVVAIAAAGWQRDWIFALAVLIAIAVAMTVSALVGTIVPRILRLLGRSPTVAAGPVVLAVADFMCLMVYFNVASALLRQ